MFHKLNTFHVNFNFGNFRGCKFSDLRQQFSRIIENVKKIEVARLTVHDHPDEFLVVHVALRVFLIVQQLLDLLVAQLLAESRQQMSQLG